MVRKNVLCAFVIGLTTTNVFPNALGDITAKVAACTSGGALIGSFSAEAGKRLGLKKDVTTNTLKANKGFKGIVVDGAPDWYWRGGAVGLVAGVIWAACEH